MHLVSIRVKSCVFTSHIFEEKEKETSSIGLTLDLFNLVHKEVIHVLIDEHSSDRIEESVSMSFALDYLPSIDRLASRPRASSDFQSLLNKCLHSLVEDNFLSERVITLRKDRI